MTAARRWARLCLLPVCGGLAGELLMRMCWYSFSCVLGCSASACLRHALLSVPGVSACAMLCLACLEPLPAPCTAWRAAQRGSACAMHCLAYYLERQCLLQGAAWGGTASIRAPCGECQPHTYGRRRNHESSKLVTLVVRSLPSWSHLLYAGRLRVCPATSWEVPLNTLTSASLCQGPLDINFLLVFRSL